MTNDEVAGQVMVVFKPEVGKSEIEQMLNGYTYAKVFDNGQFDNATDRGGQLLARWYSLSVTAGEETIVLDKLKEKYGPKIIEMAYLPPVRIKIGSVGGK
ncbi:MAG TPA: hypothetical protein HA362_05795 [Nanoarchaeota archaeon]|nr:hypothetical protein [Nanoarchaeota archaeon]